LDADVLIQVSGKYGSRQEEAQRLGRVRPKADRRSAHFYTLVSCVPKKNSLAIDNFSGRTGLQLSD